MTQHPIIELTGVSRVYIQGEEEFAALKDISLSIRAGEFVAIMGQSGSGKSTLMNILGCLDRASSGTYRVKGRDVAGLDADELSSLRREVFGFVFQRYNLLTGSNARENVEMPATYASMAQDERRKRAENLLARLGLAERLNYLPSQLSGGQQQRVSIARALMNGGEIILADEPTGALDSGSGREVLDLLKELHGAGHTVILITHDASVAQRAHRIIQLSDGTIISDEATENARPEEIAGKLENAPESTQAAPSRMAVSAAVGMALRSLKDNRLRTLLTLLGIIIGVASVVTMLAIGNGAKAQVLATIESMGSDLIMVRTPPPSARSTSKSLHLEDADVTALRALPGVAGVVGENSGTVSVRYQEADHQSSYTATTVDKPIVANWEVTRGEFFNEQDFTTSGPVAVLGTTVVAAIFPAGVDPVGKYVSIKNVPFLVVGVMATKGANAFGNDQDDTVLVPRSTARLRLAGSRYVSNITVKAAPGQNMDALQASIQQLLFERHGSEEFRVLNTTSIMEAVNESQDTLTIMLGSVAAISLLVGGIGVMNIMLVSVIERTREIGIRMACGARRRDIMSQFITEALVVCTLGGLVGVAIGFLTGFAAGQYGVPIQFTLSPVVLAFSCAFLTGLIFGFAPARKASRLDPVVALASE